MNGRGLNVWPFVRADVRIMTRYEVVRTAEGVVLAPLPWDNQEKCHILPDDFKGKELFIGVKFPVNEKVEVVAINNKSHKRLVPTPDKYAVAGLISQSVYSSEPFSLLMLNINEEKDDLCTCGIKMYDMYIRNENKVFISSYKVIKNRKAAPSCKGLYVPVNFLPPDTWLPKYIWHCLIDACNNINKTRLALYALKEDNIVRNNNNVVSSKKVIQLGVARESVNATQ
jgi:hypothetical protein